MAGAGVREACWRSIALWVACCGLWTPDGGCTGPQPYPEVPAADEEVMHVGRRVYVSNLAWRTSWQDLKDT